MLVFEVEREGRVGGAGGAPGAGIRVGVFGLAWVAMFEEVVLGMTTFSASCNWAADSITYYIYTNVLGEDENRRGSDQKFTCSIASIFTI